MKNAASEPKFTRGMFLCGRDAQRASRPTFRYCPSVGITSDDVALAGRPSDQRRVTTFERV